MSELDQNRKTQCEHMFSALPLRADIAEQSRHVRFVPTTDMSIGAARPAAKDRRSATRSWGLLPYYSRSTSVVSTCRRSMYATPQHENFSLRAAAVSISQTESPPRLAGSRYWCRWLTGTCRRQ